MPLPTAIGGAAGAANQPTCRGSTAGKGGVARAPLIQLRMGGGCRSDGSRASVAKPSCRAGSGGNGAGFWLSQPATQRRRAPGSRTSTYQPSSSCRSRAGGTGGVHSAPAHQDNAGGLRTSDDSGAATTVEPRGRAGAEGNGPGTCTNQDRGSARTMIGTAVRSACAARAGGRTLAWATGVNTKATLTSASVAKPGWTGRAGDVMPARGVLPAQPRIAGGNTSDCSRGSLLWPAWRATGRGR